MRTVMARKEDVRQQAGVLAYKIDPKDQTVKICVVNTNRTGGWTLPKGGVEGEETLRQAAKREAWEEAGLKGVVAKPPVGRYFYSKKRTGEKQRVTVFAMQVTKESMKYPEVKMRKRKWVALGSLSRLIPELRQILADFKPVQPEIPETEAA